jgi:hypothetical protein
MATLMSSRLTAITGESLDGASLVTALRPWQRQLSLQQVVRWTMAGLLTGLLLACAVLLMSRLLPWATALYWAIGFALVPTLISLVAAIRYRPTIADTAYTLDERLSLHNRLGTAWELRDETSAITHLQRRDAFQRLQQHTPRTALPLRLSRITLLSFLIMVAALILLIVLPNPMTNVLKQQAAFQAQIDQQVKTIEKMRQELPNQPGITAEQQKQIDQILQNLETKLKNAKSLEEAQQALADAQAKIDQLRNPQVSNKAEANAAASSSLQNSSNANLKSLGQALANGDARSLDEALKKLSEQVDKMSDAERRQLAQQIEAASNQASQDAELSSSLHQLAKSIADGSKSEMNDAAKQLQNASAKNTAEQNKNTTLNKTEQSLQQVANSLTAATDNPNQNQQGQQSQQGQNQQGQQGQNQQNGQQGQQGQNQQNGQQGQQSGQQGQNQQGQQGQQNGQQGQQGGQQGQQSGGNQGGASGGKTNAGNEQGKMEQVYVPGQTGTGSSTQTSDNSKSSVNQSGSDVPYTQVIQDYSQQAHDAIDNSSVPPDTKDLVYDYFKSLEGQ